MTTRRSLRHAPRSVVDFIAALKDRSPMALVKTSKITARHSPAPSAPHALKAASRSQSTSKRRKSPDGFTTDTLSERMAAATEQLARGLAEASSAAHELGGSMTQIAGGADEAAGASQAQLAAIGQIFDALRTTRLEAEASQRRIETTQNSSPTRRRS